MLLTTAALMKHQHMVEEKQVTTQVNPHVSKPCPFKTAKAPPGTSQISNLLGSDQPISRQVGKRVERPPINFAIDGNGANRRDRRLHSNLVSVQQPASVRTHPLFTLLSILLPAMGPGS